MTEQEMYILFYVANNERFVKSLTDEQRLILINHAKDYSIDSCLCCPCFGWNSDEDGTITTGYCTVGGEPKMEEKGECPDA